MRLAVYNVENLFDRARVMNLDNWADGKAFLDNFAKLNAILGKIAYSSADKRRMVDLFVKLGLDKSDTSQFVILRQSKGKLLRRARNGKLEIIVDGRAQWAGSLELRDEPISEKAMQTTAQVLIDVGADVLGVIEAESRPALSQFNAQLIAARGGTPYRHAMLIDGNDDRGIDVGLLTGEQYPIGIMRSHVDERQENGKLLFSRDCAEFLVMTPSGETLLVMLNHFKSKGFGSQQASNAKRLAQASRVAEIYQERLAQGYEHIAVMGDFNDTPDSGPLQPLIKEKTLKDVFLHPAFDDGGRPGTFGSCAPGNKIDYILLSPSLFEKVATGGVFRKGMWPGARPARWVAYPEVSLPHEAASDHAAIWVDIDL